MLVWKNSRLVYSQMFFGNQKQEVGKFYDPFMEVLAQSYEKLLDLEAITNRKLNLRKHLSKLTGKTQMPKNLIYKGNEKSRWLKIQRNYMKDQLLTF